MKALSYLLLVFIGLNFGSCKKDTDEMLAPIADTAKYKIIIEGTWKYPDHTIPPTEHFTTFVGCTHNESTNIFKINSLASISVERVAEDGNSTPLKTGIRNYISTNKATDSISIEPAGITTKDSAVITVTKNNSYVSFISMIAPSPDWFVGIDSYNLIQNNNWVETVVIDGYGYDAGTESGDAFYYYGPATVPQENIKLLTPQNASVLANGNAVIAPMIKVYFIKQ